MTAAALRIVFGTAGSGKSTIANLVERGLHALGRHTYVLDGDRLRHGLNRDLGFGEADRAENVRRISEVAALFTDAGLIVLVSAISPYRADRARAREVAGEAADGGGVGAAVVVHQDDEGQVRGLGDVVQRLPGHAAGQGAVADEGQDRARPVLQPDRLGQPVRRG